MSRELVVVGGGNMGAALVAGLLASGEFDAASLAIAEKLDARCAELREQFPGVSVGDTVPACRSAVIAVKPPDVADAATDAAAAGAARILSIAAGVSTATIEAATGDAVPVVRAMPNTPALLGKGVSVIAGGRHAGEADLAWAERILGAVGICVRLGEDRFDAVTGLTGSGPAYVFLVAEALIDAGVLVGLPRTLVETMVTQLLVGSAALLEDRGDPAALRAMVTSPGGTTAAGLRVLEERATRAAFIDAVHAAAARSRQLGDG